MTVDEVGRLTALAGGTKASLLSDKAKLEERVRVLEALISEEHIERLADDIACAVADCRQEITATRRSAMLRLGQRLREPYKRDLAAVLNNKSGQSSTGF